MAPIKTRFLMVVAFLSVCAFLPVWATGAIVDNPVTTAGGSVFGGGNWATGVSLEWSVADTGSAYLYSYTFVAPTPGLSHFELQVSDNFTEANILAISSEKFELKEFSAGIGESNPGWPEGESLYGIKFEGFDDASPWTFTLLSDRAPMEGDFYAKGGTDSFAYNSGFGDRDGANILVPDTSPYFVPEPGTMLLLGSGLIGLAGLGKKRFHT